MSEKHHRLGFCRKVLLAFTVFIIAGCSSNNEVSSETTVGGDIRQYVGGYDTFFVFDAITAGILTQTCRDFSRTLFYTASGNEITVNIMLPDTIGPTTLVGIYSTSSGAFLVSGEAENEDMFGEDDDVVTGQVSLSGTFAEDSLGKFMTGTLTYDEPNDLWGFTNLECTFVVDASKN